MTPNKILLVFALIFSTFASAQVGIGTQNPQGFFNVDGAKDNATSGAPTVSQQANDFVVLSDGKVGIGTTAPNQSLQVVGNINFSGALMPNNDAGTAGQVLTSAGAGAVPTWATPAGATNIYNTNGTLTGNRVVTQGANTLTFSGSGNVGLGITPTVAKLDVGSSLVATDNVNAAATLLQLSRPSASNVKWGSIARFNMGSYEASPSPNNYAKSRLDLAMTDTNGSIFTNVMTWQANGNVGIGTTAPKSKLEVNGAATNTVALNAAAATTIDFAASNLAYTAATANAITLSNIKDGGAYSLIFTSTAVNTAVTFSASGFTFKYMGTGDRTSGKAHIYSFIVADTVVYVSMSTEN